MEQSNHTTKTGKPQETRAQRDTRVLLEGLREGVHETRPHHLSEHYMSSGTLPGVEYTVFSGIWEHRRTEHCTCEWGMRAGDVLTDNPGTQQQTSNGVLPCKHMLVLRWAELSVPQREVIALKHLCLRPYVYWNEPIERTLRALLARADAWQAQMGVGA